MTDFSDYCSKLLDGNGLNVYNFSKTTGYERTAASRILKGVKKPDLDFVIAYSKYLRLSPSEETRLKELLEIEIVGKATYENRLFIRELLDELFLQNTPYFTNYNSCCNITDSALLDSAKESLAINNEHDLIMFANHILSSEYRTNDTPTIYTDVPISYDDITNILYNLDITYKKKSRINHYILLHSNPQFQSEANYNLKVLRHFIPMYLTFYSDYNVYYSYTKNYASSRLYSAFPYSLVTSEYVLLFSTSLNKGVYIHNRDIAKNYMNDYHNIQRNYKYLSHTQKYHDSSLFSLINIPSSMGTATHCLDSHFCAHYAVDNINDVIDYSKFDDAITSQIKSLLCDTDNDRFINNVNMIIPADALKRFYESGIIDLQFKYVLKDFTPDERLAIMNKIIVRLKSPNNKLQLLKPFNYSPNLNFNNNSVYIQLYGSQNLIIIFLQPNHEFRVMNIDEVGICTAFFDFFTYLEEKELLYNSEEAINYIKNILNP